MHYDNKFCPMSRELVVFSAFLRRAIGPICLPFAVFPPHNNNRVAKAEKSLLGQVIRTGQVPFHRRLPFHLTSTSCSTSTRAPSPFLPRIPRNPRHRQDERHLAREGEEGRGRGQGREQGGNSVELKSFGWLFRRFSGPFFDFFLKLAVKLLKQFIQMSF